MVCDDGRAQDLVRALLDMHARKPVVFTVQDGPVHLIQLEREGVHFQALGLGICFIHAHVCDLRLRKGRPRHDQRIGAGIAQPERMREQRVLNHDLGHRIGRMGELERETHVAGGKNARVGRLQAIIHFDADLGVIRHADCVQSEALHVGGTADADQDLINCDVVVLAV